MLPGDWQFEKNRMTSKIEVQIVLKLIESPDAWVLPSG